MKKKAKLVPTVRSERVVLEEHIPLETPLVVYVEPSGYCNLKCLFCPQGVEGHSLKKGIMPVELFEKFIDDLAAFPDPVRLLRICGNGEPLMNKNIMGMLQYAQEHKTATRVEMVTNGLLLTEDLIKGLPRFLDRVIISIEGLCSEDYRRTSGATVEFEDLLANIDALYANKGECVIHIKTIEETVSSEGKKSQFFDLFNDRCDEIYIEKIVPMWPQLDIARSPNEFRWGGELVTHKVCAQIFKGLQVQADGEVVPCCVDWKRVNILGDINKNSLYEIWHGKRLRKLQLSHLLGKKGGTEPCKECTMNDYCEVDNIDAHAIECFQRMGG